MARLPFRLAWFSSQPLTSPAYDMGKTEAELRETWMAHFVAIQPKAQ